MPSYKSERHIIFANSAATVTLYFPTLALATLNHCRFPRCTLGNAGAVFSYTSAKMSPQNCTYNVENKRKYTNVKKRTLSSKLHGFSNDSIRLKHFLR